MRRLDHKQIKTEAIQRQLPLSPTAEPIHASAVSVSQIVWLSRNSSHACPAFNATSLHLQCQLTLLPASTLAPATISNRQAAVWPLPAANRRGVYWFCSGGEWFWRGAGGVAEWDKVYRDRRKGNYGPGIYALGNYQGMSAAYSKQLQDLVIPIRHQVNILNRLQ